MDTYNDKTLTESVADRGVHSDGESDASSELKQAGVKQVEAVTQAWSPAMMWLVFVLFVLQININWPPLIRRLPDFTLSHSWTRSYRPSTAVWSLM